MPLIPIATTLIDKRQRIYSEKVEYQYPKCNIFLTRDHCFCFNFILNSDSSLEVMVMIKCKYLTCLRIMIMAFWFEKKKHIKNTLLTYHSKNSSVIHSIANLLCSEKRFHKNCLNTKF